MASAGTTSVLGDVIRAQRQMANLSLRQLSALAHVSNPYLSQVERGLHQPSVLILRSIAEALDVSAEALLGQAGPVGGREPDEVSATASAIMADPRLSPPQRAALLGVYRSYVDENPQHAATLDPAPPGRSAPGRRPRQARRTTR